MVVVRSIAPLQDDVIYGNYVRVITQAKFRVGVSKTLIEIDLKQESNYVHLLPVKTGTNNSIFF